MPVITTGLPLVAVHALLNHGPLAIRGDNEAVQIEVKPVLHRGAIDLRHETACVDQAIAVDADAIAQTLQLVRRFSRMLAAPTADIDAEFVLQRLEAALERADYAGGD